MNRDRLRRTPAHDAFRAARDLLIEHRTDHDRAYELFRWPRLDRFNWALEWFDVIAEHNHRPALVLLDGDGGAETRSFAELSRDSDTLAVRLLGLGVRRGERVLIALDQRRELWETILACLKIGAVVIPTYTSLTPAEAADRLERAWVGHVVCEARLVPLFDGIEEAAGLRTRIAVGSPVRGDRPGRPPWHDLRDCTSGPPVPFLPSEPTPADDVAFCYFTSGTTASPKLVAHTHTSYPVGHLSGMYWSGLLPGDRHLNVSAPGWAKHSWSSLFVPWNAEATVVALPPGPTPVERVPRLLVRHAVTTFCAPPSTWRALLPVLDSARPRLREALSAGEPLDDRIVDAVDREWGVRVRDGYGQTETTGLIGTTPGLPRRPGRLGKALPGYRIGLRDRHTGLPARHGEVGVELIPQPVGVMRGYLTSDGWIVPPGTDYYRTGDLGEVSTDGWIRLDGRDDDVFKSFDHRISPYEVEAVLRDHPAVDDAAVIPIPHPVGGFVPHAVVERTGPARPELERELLDFVDARVPPELRVHSVTFSPRLPRTASGKIRRGALRESGAGDADDRSDPSPPPDKENHMSPRTQPRHQPRDVLVVGNLLTPEGRDAVDWQRWTEPGRAGTDIHDLYRSDPGKAHAFLVRFAPGAHGDLHEHPDHELMFVLDGELENDNGDRYGVGDLVVERPNSIHRVDSTRGCTLLVIREAPVHPVP